MSIAIRTKINELLRIKVSGCKSITLLLKNLSFVRIVTFSRCYPIQPMKNLHKKIRERLTLSDYHVPVLGFIFDFPTSLKMA